MQHGKRLPLLLQLLNGQSPEQLLFPIEIVLHHGDKQALAKPAGTTEEIVLSTLDEFVHQCALVCIEIVVCADGLEVLYANGIFHKPEFSAKIQIYFDLSKCTKQNV